jgi:hypothetical protein
MESLVSVWSVDCVELVVTGIGLLTLPRLFVAYPVNNHGDPLVCVVSGFYTPILVFMRWNDVRLNIDRGVSTIAA